MTIIILETIKNIGGDLVKIKYLFFSIIFSALLLVGCTDKKEKPEDVTKENEVYHEFMTDYIALMEKGKLLEAEESMKKAFKEEKFTMKEQSTILDAFLYGISLKSEELSKELTDFNVNITEFLEDKNSFIEQKDIDQIKDTDFKVFAQKILDNYLLVESLGDGNYQLVADIQYLLKEYDKNMLPVLKDYLIAYMEISKSLEYDEKDYKTLLVNIENNINILQAFLDTYHEGEKDYDETLYSFYQNRIAYDLQGHYEVFFGLAHDYFLNDKNDNTYPKDIVDYYKTSYEKTINPIFKTKLEKVLALLKDNNNKLSSDAKKKLETIIAVIDTKGNLISEGNVDKSTSIDDLDKTDVIQGDESTIHQNDKLKDEIDSLNKEEKEESTK